MFDYTAARSMVAERSILGIDAAWTITQPSGLALVAEVNGAWQLLAVAPSYLDFLAPIETNERRAAKPSGSKIDTKALVAAAEIHAGRRPDLVAADMPLAHTPITTRRASDNAVSRSYGAKWCSTHTPSVTRPGPVGEAMRSAFAAEGYPLATETVAGPSLIEVYPHPALVELAKADRRLPYKVQKTRSYWPDFGPSERRRALLETWDKIVALLDSQITGTRALLPTIETAHRGATLKAFEDMLDAVVCAWVGITVLEGRAAPHGDADSAIWIPKSSV